VVTIVEGVEMGGESGVGGPVEGRDVGVRGVRGVACVGVGGLVVGGGGIAVVVTGVVLRLKSGLFKCQFSTKST
jgi:hypothetical protein